MDVDEKLMQAASSSGESDSEEEPMELHFRSYEPRDEALKTKLLPPIIVAEEIKWVHEWLHSIMTSDAAEREGVSIAPKKPNWDLKRDVQDRLGRLDDDTQRAIAEMIAEKMNVQV
jgi:coiled-coil domain-containing protein 12